LQAGTDRKEIEPPMDTMQLLDDGKLLSEYATRHSEEAFATLVERHVSLVYSAALRQAAIPIWPKKSPRRCSLFWRERRGRPVRKRFSPAGAF